MSQDPVSRIQQGAMAPAQIGAVALCVLLNALDGFDVLAISFAAPGISDDWGIDRGTLGFVLSVELIGMGLGSLLIGPLADRRGRRPTILICLLLMACGMFGAAFARTVFELSVLRLLTGIGIGGMLAAINAMAAEYASLRWRNVCVMLMAGGYPVGVMIGGSVASTLLEHYAWPAVFLLGGTLTLGLLPLVWRYLPESIEFLCERRPPNALERVNATLQRMQRAPVQALPPPSQTLAPALRTLFEGPLLRITLCLLIAYFFHIMSFYFLLKWMPKLLTELGFSAAEAGRYLVWANLGGALGCVLIALLSRILPTRVLVLSACAASAFAIALFGQVTVHSPALLLSAVAGGFFTNAAIVGLYALFAASYPTALRASGTGLVIGLGRGGAALGPIIAGFLLETGVSTGAVAATMALGSVVALVALWLLPNPSSAAAMAST